MLELLRKAFPAPGLPYTSWELDKMYHPEAGYPQFQFSLKTSQECSRREPSGWYNGRFPLMRRAGNDVYHGWMVDPDVPLQFWQSRRQEIIEGKAPDGDFVPLVPDIGNLLKHPVAVIKAVREWKEARDEHGENFQFVFLSDPTQPAGMQYRKELYLFSPGGDDGIETDQILLDSGPDITGV